MNKVELAYTAGLFDGEGSVSIHQTLYSVALHIQIANANFEALSWIKDSFGGSISIYKDRRNGHSSYRWRTASKKASFFLEQVLPFLRIKVPQANLALKFQSLKKHGSEYQKGELDNQKEYKVSLERMNREQYIKYDRKEVK